MTDLLQGPAKVTDLQLIWAKVRQLPDGCWLWTGSISQNGYGEVGRWNPPRKRRAHRALYEYLVGPVPQGLDLDHLCRNRACVNPAHLEPVTRGENLLRGKNWKRRVAARGELLCSSGHAKEVFSDGSVRCRECRNARRRVG